jgi:hypothetical protein
MQCFSLQGDTQCEETFLHCQSQVVQAIHHTTSLQ